MLTAWKILHQVIPLTSDKEHALFPALLQLFDQAKRELPGQFFLTRNLNLDDLLDTGFIERRGRYTSILLDENGTTHEVSVKSAGKPGLISYANPVDGKNVELPLSAVEKFGVNRDWLDEIVLKRIKSHLVTAEFSKLDDHLTYLGKIKLGADVAPCYLARDLRTPAARPRFLPSHLTRANCVTGLPMPWSVNRSSTTKDCCSLIAPQRPAR